MAIRIQNPKPSISIHPTITPFKTHFNSHNLFITIPPRTRVLQIQPPSLSITRRSFLPSVSGIWDAITGGNNAREAIQAIRRGMLLFRQGDVSGSLVEFDKAIELDPRQKAYLWQRGLSLYYVNRFEEGAEQFQIDVAQNPNDTEESIWCFLCEAQLYSADEARRRFLEVGRDPRPVMREAYNMFKDGGDPEKSCTIHGAQTGRYGEAGCGREGADGGVGSGLVPDGQADPANSGGNRWVEGGDEKPDRRGPRGTAPAGRSHGLLASSVRERAGARGSGPA